MDGDQDLYLQVLRMFVDHTRDDGAKLLTLLGEADWPAAERLAHSTKSVAASVGLKALSEASRELEGLLRVKAPPESLQGPAQRFVQLLDDALRTVAHALAVLDGQADLLPPLVVDQVACVADLQRLVRLLRAHDGEALDVFEARSGSLEVALEQATFVALRKALSSFDFDAAATQAELALTQLQA